MAIDAIAKVSKAFIALSSEFASNRVSRGMLLAPLGLSR
jgi:hypothetical protein